jgi:peptidoglycan/xylan/chitin deacetylase (PgdA/CDA1 family)
MKDQSYDSLKRAVKCGISLGLYAGSALGRLIARLVGKSSRGSCVVVYYHSVVASERTLFANQLDQLLRYAKPIALNERMITDPGSHCVSVTFDDGFQNFCECALPELQKRGIPATMFLIYDVIGKVFGPPGCREKVMSLEQLRDLPRDLVTLGSHTLTHPLLPAIDIEAAAREITLSRARLEEKLNRKVLLFSFPYGGFNEELVEICRRTGYQRVFSTLPQFAFENPDEFVTGRVRVDPTDWPLEFRLKLAGAYRWLPWAFELKRRTVSNTFAQKITGLKNRE